MWPQWGSSDFYRKICNLALMLLGVFSEQLLWGCTCPASRQRRIWSASLLRVQQYISGSSVSLYLSVSLPIYILTILPYYLIYLHSVPIYIFLPTKVGSCSILAVKGKKGMPLWKTGHFLPDSSVPVQCINMHIHTWDLRCIWGYIQEFELGAQQLLDHFTQSRKENRLVSWERAST